MNQISYVIIIFNEQIKSLLTCQSDLITVG